MASKRILFATFGSLGDLYPYLAVASEMQRRGHCATILTCSQHRSRIEQAGIRFLQAAPDLDFSDPVFQELAMREKTGGRYMLRDVVLPQIRSSYENLLEASRDADLLVTQTLAYAGPIVAEKTGVPWVSTILAPLSFFSYRDSPVLAARLHGVRRRAPWLNAFINRVARSTTRPWNAPVYQLRRELGLSPGLEPIYEGQHSPSKVLAMFSPVLSQPQADWPPQTQVSGFPVWEEQPGGQQLRVLDDFLAAGPAPVVFTLGSSAVLNPGEFYERSAEAARRLGVRAILLDGRGEAQSDGPGVLRLAYAPHSYLFERASVVVHSAGIGTCARAMRAARPMLLTPFAYDQPDNAFRLVRLGVARCIGRGGYSARRAEQEIGALLADPSYRVNAERLGRIVNAENGTCTAADALESRL